MRHKPNNTLPNKINIRTCGISDNETIFIQVTICKSKP